MDKRWSTLLEEARAAHARLPTLQEFCAFPDPLTEQSVTPRTTPAVEMMERDTGLYSDTLTGFRDALIGAAPLAHWRDTYRDTALSDLFWTRFACYEILGQNAPFGTDQMRGFMIYQPANFHYPWHHHPAEELYLVVAGEGEFALQGEDTATLRPGQTAYHPSNAPHALITRDHPIMAYVLWRGDLDTPPTLTPKTGDE